MSYSEKDDLFQLIARGSLDAVKYLIEKMHFPIEMKHPKSQMKPLITAVLFNRAEITEYLLSKGADVNGKGPKNTTPLYAAASQGDIKIAEILVNKGATIDIKNLDGITPLFAAACDNYVSVANLLIDNGANINLKCNGVAPLSIASKNNKKNEYKLK